MRQYNTETNVKGIAGVIFEGYKKMFEDFDAAVEEYREEWPKYKYPTCIHGTSQWTDYDNICGPCEDGYGWWNEEAFTELSRNEAEYFCETLQKDYDEMQKIFEAVTQATDIFSKSYAVTEFVEWHRAKLAELDARMLKKLGLNAD